MRRAAIASAAAAATAAVATGVPAAPASALDDGLARTPPMGWNGWYAFGCDVNEATVIATANAIVRTGMRAAGYRYVNLDDCWMARTRARGGALRPDRSRFPHGIAALANRLHARGLKLGIYLSAGRMTCQRRAGSAGHLAQDADTVAAWGADLVKLDWCFAGGMSAPAAYARMRDALRATGRPIVFSICEWGSQRPWTWGPSTGHMWRITHDTPFVRRGDRWASALAVAAIDGALGAHAGPGAWNDPDILQTGLQGLTTTESRTIFSLWSIIAAPLLAGNDVITMPGPIRATLVNREVIAVDQDPAGRQGVRASARDGRDLWVRSLADGDRAALLVNRTARPATLVLRPGAVTSSTGRRFAVRDLWRHRTRIAGTRMALRVRAHEAAMFRIRPLG